MMHVVKYESNELDLDSSTCMSSTQLTLARVCPDLHSPLLTSPQYRYCSRRARQNGGSYLSRCFCVMSLLLETTLGDIVIDLDVDGSPALCRNILKLVKVRYYTNTLIYNIQPGRLCQLGDPRGDGRGGASIYGLIDSLRNGLGNQVERSRRRFLKSEGRELSLHEMRAKGRLVASEMSGMKDTIGSQLLLTIDGGADGKALDGLANSGAGAADSSSSPSVRYLSLGVVAEDDDDVLAKINGLYCDRDGRPYADVRIVRAHILDDPFDDPEGIDEVLEARGVQLSWKLLGGGEIDSQKDDDGSKSSVPRLASASPSWERPSEEIVERRISADVALVEEDDGDEEKAEEREESLRRKEDKSRAVVLEMLGDLPSAEIQAPENVLFVCKLNSITEDDDLELIFSRFDSNARAEIIRDPDTGDSLCYAFVEFTNKEQCNEAYFKMNNALVDDRRIKVDFSQSVAKVWNKYTQRSRIEETDGRGGVPMPGNWSTSNQKQSLRALHRSENEIGQDSQYGTHRRPHNMRKGDDGYYQPHKDKHQRRGRSYERRSRSRSRSSNRRPEKTKAGISTSSSRDRKTDRSRYRKTDRSRDSKKYYKRRDNDNDCDRQHRKDRCCRRSRHRSRSRSRGDRKEGPHRNWADDERDHRFERKHESKKKRRYRSRSSSREHKKVEQHTHKR